MMIWRMSEIKINHVTIYIKMLYFYSVEIITIFKLQTPISVSLFPPFSTVLTLISCFYKIISVNACLRWDMRCVKNNNSVLIPDVIQKYENII